MAADSEHLDPQVESWRPVFRQVIIRALCDALGYTNLNPARSGHGEAVRVSQRWFLHKDQLEDFNQICDLAGVDAFRVRKIAKNLIQAKWSGDFTRVPEFWRVVFAENRMPNLTNIERALDRLAK